MKHFCKFTIIFELHPEVSFEKDIIVARSKDEAMKIKKGEFEIKKEKVEEVPANAENTSKKEEK